MRAAALALALLLPGAALAQSAHKGHATAASAHEGHGAMAAAPAAGGATAEFEAAAATMHRDMAIEYTGNVDVDFLRGMIPHHEAAVKMAQIALAHSEDAEVRALAEAIVAAQEAEITQMRAMLERLGAK